MVKKVSVFCIWRDSEQTIFKTLKQLEDLESINGFEFSYFFYENDSKDKTVEILSEWMSKRNGSFLSEVLNTKKFGSITDPERMKLLCECRNKCKNLAKENNFDYSLLIDSDIEFNNDNFLLQVDFFDKKDEVVMTTANVRQSIPDYTFGLSEDSYYDVYPFRDKHGNSGIYFSDCPSYKKEDQFDWKLGKPILCMSSFGGFAIVKSWAFNQVEWDADIHCDHVNMCFDLNQYGSIYCIPRSKVYVDVGIEKINIENCKEISANQKQHYIKYFA
jgi:hypothetical protein